MDKANEEVLRECAADYHNALKAFQKAKAELLLAEETVKANLSANKLYSTSSFALSIFFLVDFSFSRLYLHLIQVVSEIDLTVRFNDGHGPCPAVRQVLILNDST